MNEADEFRLPPAPASSRDVRGAADAILFALSNAKADVISEMRRIEVEIRAKPVSVSYVGFVDVFVPAFLGVLAGGYIVKYWL